MTLYYVKRREMDKFLLVGDIVPSFHGRMGTVWSHNDAYDFSPVTRQGLMKYGFRTISAAKRSPAYRNRANTDYWDFVSAEIVKIDFDDFVGGFREV